MVKTSFFFFFFLVLTIMVTDTTFLETKMSFTSNRLKNCKYFMYWKFDIHLTDFIDYSYYTLVILLDRKMLLLNKNWMKKMNKTSVVPNQNRILKKFLILNPIT